MNHFGKKTNSSIIVKGALKDEAKKVFRGTIDFKTGAIKSIGEESENVIALSAKVKTDSIPLLLCGEDDVSGNHSASVGKINEDKLFYLMSRGFNKKDANKIIIEGEFSSIINTIPDESTSNKVINIIQRRLENE
ncbi:FeS cluster assembly protein SufD [compost metagenome]